MSYNKASTSAVLTTESLPFQPSDDEFKKVHISPMWKLTGAQNVIKE